MRHYQALGDLDTARRMAELARQCCRTGPHARSAQLDAVCRSLEDPSHFE
ncbi:hypothetical protein ACFVXC_00170 [Streptomyces sp. NPDC058257]